MTHDVFQGSRQPAKQKLAGQALLQRFSPSNLLAAGKQLGGFAFPGADALSGTLGRSGTLEVRLARGPRDTFSLCRENDESCVHHFYLAPIACCNIM